MTTDHLDMELAALRDLYLAHIRARRTNYESGTLVQLNEFGRGTAGLGMRHGAPMMVLERIEPRPYAVQPDGQIARMDLRVLYIESPGTVGIAWIDSFLVEPWQQPDGYKAFAPAAATGAAVN